MKVQVTFRSMSTSAGQVKNGDIVDLPEAEIQKILKMKPQALVILPELPIEEPKVAPKPAIKSTPKPKAKAKKDAKLIN